MVCAEHRGTIKAHTSPRLPSKKGEGPSKPHHLATQGSIIQDPQFRTEKGGSPLKLAAGLNKDNIEGGRNAGLDHPIVKGANEYFNTLNPNTARPKKNSSGMKKKNQGTGPASRKNPPKSPQKGGTNERGTAGNPVLNGSKGRLKVEPPLMRQKPMDLLRTSGGQTIKTERKN